MLFSWVLAAALLVLHDTNDYWEKWLLFPLQMVVTEEIKNLRRLEAQRNELNAKGKFFTTFFEDRS